MGVGAIVRARRGGTGKRRDLAEMEEEDTTENRIARGRRGPVTRVPPSRAGRSLEPRIPSPGLIPRVVGKFLPPPVRARPDGRHRGGTVVPRRRARRWSGPS
jgi:hypothetical protein